MSGQESQKPILFHAIMQRDRYEHEMVNDDPGANVADGLPILIILVK